MEHRCGDSCTPDNCITAKPCGRCGEEKPLSAYQSKKGSADGLQYWCRTCTSRAMRDWRAANPEKERARNRRATFAKYGVDQDWYDAKVVEQADRCAICGGAPDRDFWDIDHDHVTGRVRGLVHGDCNRAIGLLGDDPSTLLAAAAYLISHQETVRV